MGIFDNLTEDIYAALLEFVGTTLFLLLGLGGIQATVAEEQAIAGIAGPESKVIKVFYVSTCMAFSLLVTVWLFYRVTGGVFNPNITFALWMIGAIGPVRFVLYTIAQLTGAIAASAIVLGLLGGLSVNCNLNPDLNLAQGVFIEMFTTGTLVFCVLMLAAEKHSTTPFAPIGIGLVLFSGHLFSVFYTGAAMNTARAFGPAAVTGFPSGQHWIYWVGPYLGSLLATALYATLKHSRYTRLNPGQDSIDSENSPRVWRHEEDKIGASPHTEQVASLEK